jgi:dCMP deaminase
MFALGVNINMTTQFKIGDQVKFIGDGYLDYLELNCFYTIKDVDEDGYINVEGASDHYFRPDQFVEGSYDIKRTILWWDEWFIGLAKYVATASKDPKTKVGAVIVDHNNRIVSTGYNGLPVGVSDLPERLNNRDIKLKMVVHAERNAILFAQRNLDGCKLYSTLMPCAVCAAMIIQTGIKYVITPKYDEKEYERWADDFKLATKMFGEAGVTLCLI